MDPVEEERPMEPPTQFLPNTPWYAGGPWILCRPMIPRAEGVFEHVANVREEEFGEFYSAVEVAQYLERLAKASLERLVTYRGSELVTEARSQRDQETVSVALAIQAIEREAGTLQEERRNVQNRLRQKLLDLVLIAAFDEEGHPLEELGEIRPDGTVVGHPGVVVPQDRREALMREARLG